jgi:acyl carrier protein
MQTIEETLRTFIDEKILFSTDGFSYTDETSFLDNGIVDSTSVLEIIAFIEEQFNISIKDSEVIPENFDSISNLSKYIRSKVRDI